MYYSVHHVLGGWTLSLAWLKKHSAYKYGEGSCEYRKSIFLNLVLQRAIFNKIRDSSFMLSSTLLSIRRANCLQWCLLLNMYIFSSLIISGTGDC